MEKLSKKQLNIIGVISISIAAIFLILVIVIPIFLKRQMTYNYIQKCTPTMDNTHLWASFPGEINSNLSHHFSFFNYEKNGKEYKINLKNNISIEEEVKYTNFSNDENNIYFLNNRSYKFLNEKKNGDNDIINNINLGMFETLETLSYPPLYKLGINAIYYLIKKVLIDPDVFIRELYSYKMSKLPEEDIIENILKKVSNESQDKIMNNINEPYKKYSLNSTSGFFEWIKILGSQEKISNSSWLNEIFSLNDSEIYSILLDENAYLIQEYKNFNKFLSQKYNCDGDQCDIKLLYMQLINSSIISELFPELKNFESLNTELNTGYYPFENSPEMKIFYEEEYQLKHKSSFEEVRPNLEQVNRLLNLTSEHCLLKIENSINFLHINKTEEKKQNQNKEYFVDLSYDKVNYLTEYFYDYLPRIFFFYNKDPGEDNKNIKEIKSYGLMPKVLANFIPIIAQKTYQKLSNFNVFSFLLARLILLKLAEKEFDDICQRIMPKFLDDEEKIDAICSDPEINLAKEDSVYLYINRFYCLPEFEQYENKCNESLNDYFKEKVNLTENEINAIFAENSTIYEEFNSSLGTIEQTYNCSGGCDSEYFTKMQFLNSWVTRNAPDLVPKSNSIKEWDPEIEEEYEIEAIRIKYNNSDEYNETDAMYIIELANIYENDLYDLDKADIFYKKITFEKKFYEALKKGKDSTMFNLYKFLMGVFLFNNVEIGDNIDINNDRSMSSLIVEYSSINNFLEGKSDENDYWINYLKKGNYFENFKPNIDSVTKFDFGFNFDTKEQKKLDLDSISISTKISDYNKRKYTKFNNLETLNLKKEEYDPFINSKINIPFPLYNFEKLLDKRKFSDGFQYDNSFEVIYYYDLISTRPLRFRREENINYKDKIECKKYVLDTNSLSADINEYFDLNNKNPFLTQKVNKPFIITDKISVLQDYGFNDLKKEDIINYICVDPISDLVIDSKLNLIYALNTRKYNLLNNEIKLEKNYPLFLYQRNFEVDVTSYESLFPGVTEYYENSTTFIIIGVIILILFIAIGLLSFIYLNKKIKSEKEDDVKNGEDLKPIDEMLIVKNNE